MPWKTTAEAPRAAWPWAKELKDKVKKGIPPDERAAIDVVESVLDKHDGLGLVGRTVLDLGCGRGVCLHEAARCGASVLVGVDLEISACRLTAWRLKQTAAEVHTFTDSSGLPSQIADVVWSHGVVEHMPEPELELYLAEMVRLSSRWVCISAPNPLNKPYQAYREHHLQRETWAFGYEEPKESYGPDLLSLGCTTVWDGPAGNDEKLSLLYAKALPMSSETYMTDWRKAGGVITVVCAKVPGAK